MNLWLIIFGILYIALLIFSAKYASNKNNNNTDEILLARSGVPILLLFLSFSATLFSTFTLMGVPNFFRVHGVGTWIFVAVSDVAMGFIVFWFGLRYKEIIDKENIRTISSLLKKRYKGGLSWKVYLFGVFIFLTPYVAIQIQGVSQLLSALTPSNIPSWFWSIGMLALILIYSWVGGLRAIMYSDVAQGTILLFVIWIVASMVIKDANGVFSIFDTIEKTSPELLTLPGPKGLMTFQFLFVSFIAILLMPITQPQLTTRIASTKSKNEIPLMALGISFFAFIILLPTIAIGFYGVIKYPDLSSGEFLAKVLVIDRPDYIGALAIIGLLAAAMSTADSQLFSLGAESQVAFSKDEEKINIKSAKFIIISFALISLILSLVSSQELVLLARVSFVGTALLAPMILIAVLSREKSNINNTIPLLTLISLGIFLLASFKLIPNSLFGIRLDLLLLLFIFFFSFMNYLIKIKKGEVDAN